MNNRFPRCIITFFGPVGVGKSTQIRLLKEHLDLGGIRTVTTFIKSSHALTYIINEPLMFFGICEKTVYDGGFVRNYPRRSIFGRLLPLWCHLDTVSIIVKFLVRVYVPYKLGFTVIIEEGPMMTLLTYGKIFPYFFNTVPRVPPIVPNLIGWIEKKNHVNIVLDANDRELIQRRKGRSYRQEELPEYVDMQRKWISLLNSRDTISLDSSGESATKIHKKMVELLGKSVRPSNLRLNATHYD